MKIILSLLAAFCLLNTRGADPASAKVDSDEGKISFQAEFKSGSGNKDKPLYGANISEQVRPTSQKLLYAFTVQAEAIERDLRELSLAIGGDGEIKSVTGEGIEEWSVRQGSTNRALVVRFVKSEKPRTHASLEIKAETTRGSQTNVISGLTLTHPQATLSSGYVLLEGTAALEFETVKPSGLTPIPIQTLPENLRPASTNYAQAYRFAGAVYTLPLLVKWADPEALRGALRDFLLSGTLEGTKAEFTLKGTARVLNPNGASIPLLSGSAALMSLKPHPEWDLAFENGQYFARFKKPGDYPLELRLAASVQLSNGWKQINFTTSPGSLQPVVLKGLPADTQFRGNYGTKPLRSGDAFIAHLAQDGRLALAWKESAPETQGTLFYAAEGIFQVVVSPGLMRETALLDFKVMQGEMSEFNLVVRGAGQVTRIIGPNLLSWKMEPVKDNLEKRFHIQLNQPQKERFSFEIQTQTPAGTFPQTLNVMDIRPEGAARFGGHFRISNEGAVRLEVLQATGLSQIAPEQFPQSEQAKALLPRTSTQVFAFRYPGGPLDLRLQADNILPETGVSEVLMYHVGDMELSIQAEMELDIREAPLRELFLQIPQGYVIAQIEASGMSDYFLNPLPGGTNSELRVVYARPAQGRQLVNLRLEKSGATNQTSWALPRIEVLKAKSVRGHVAVSATAGYRVTPGLTQGLTDIEPAFFPRKLPGIQAAFRLSDPAWQATINIERLPQTIQADVFHLFSIGEGIAYGSSLINYIVSGAPVNLLRVALTNEYFNVEFTGKDVRSWQQTNGVYVIQLHTPISGAYALLATYERPFRRQGETLRFIGAQPLDAPTEQGHTVVVSTHQFQVRPVNVSGGLEALEPGEVPPEYRLFFDAPVLAAYRYQSRPFNLELELKPLGQAETLGQVVDRAALVTHASKEGQVVTEARYFLKSKTAPTFPVVLPAGAQLWSVTVNSNRVSPVTSGSTNLIPLPATADANTVLNVELKIASRAQNPDRFSITAPIVNAPVLLADWQILPEAGRRLIYRGGSVTPRETSGGNTGFEVIAELLRNASFQQMVDIIGSLILVLLGVLLFRSTLAPEVSGLSIRHVTGGLLGLAAFAASAVLFLHFWRMVPWNSGAHELHFLPPVQAAQSIMRVEVSNESIELSAAGWIHALWPAVLACLAFFASWIFAAERLILRLAGWTILCWAALRLPYGVNIFFPLLGLFVLLEILLPVLRAWWRVPRKARTVAAAAGAALFFLLPMQSSAQETPPSPQLARMSRAESAEHHISITNDLVLGKALLHWKAVKGQILPLLHAPAVLTKADFPTGKARLVQNGGSLAPGAALVAEESGLLDVQIEYQLAATTRDGARGFQFALEPAMVNQLEITIKEENAEVIVPQAVTISRTQSAGQVAMTLALPPLQNQWISWQPRSRDPHTEKAVFYAEISHLFVPGPGLIEGLHVVNCRPSQGELSEVSLTVPPDLTITDVTGSNVSTWRFDPAKRQLRVSLTPALSKPFSITVKSQAGTAAFPYEQTLGLLRVDNAAAEVGQVGIATGAESQLDDAVVTGLTPINLEDFPSLVLEVLRGQTPGIGLRRAYRYSDAGARLTLKASAVQPDVRVTSRQTLSLAEDRVVLAINLDVTITRAGIFKLSFALPPGLDVDSISGAALSHWTELKTDSGRMITLHLKSRTEGTQSFALTLTGSGLRTVQAWNVPQVTLREASKETGQLIIVPEQGMRIQPTVREGVTQFDPNEAGVRQKGVAAFRLLQKEWKLALDLERLESWAQVTTLQQALCEPSLVRITGSLLYEIENAGLKTLHVRLPASASNVRFQGEQIADFSDQAVSTNTALRDWEIKLNRKMRGRLLLRVEYTEALAPGATNLVLRGIQVENVNLQRGFVTIQSSSRLQARVDSAPPALQRAEPQSIPRALRQNTAPLAADYTFRLVEPVFALTLRLERHEAAKVLPARVASVELISSLSDTGAGLTQTKLSIIPGDKQLLRLNLPAGAQFWFAFVNQNSVWPWREGDSILIPLEQHSKGSEPVTVEFLYASQTASVNGAAVNVDLTGPKFDLPLENITWRVYLNDKWHVKKWSGSLELREDLKTFLPMSSVQSYAARENVEQQQKTQEAAQYLSLGRTLLEKGNPEEARRAFQNAYGLSQHDNAFNEDARVQLHNLKTQQALVGLNVRQSKIAGAPEAAAGPAKQWREGAAPAYSQQQARDLIERNSAEDNDAQMRLVERLIQQQEAGAVQAVAIHAAVPEQGQLLTFQRSLQVETNSDLRIQLSVKVRQPFSLPWRGAVLASLAALLGVLLFLSAGRSKAV